MAVDHGARSVIGQRRPRPDSGEKVLGRTRYAADRPIPGLLHARIVPSLYAHARIRSIDASDALAVPGVVAVLTAADLPIVGRADYRMYEPLAREEALFAGHPVALVVAETEAAAADAVGLVMVDAERLPVVLDVEAAMRSDSPLARETPMLAPAADGEGDDEDGAPQPQHAAVGGAGAELLDEDLSANVVARKRFASGDVAAALAASAHVVEATFTTNWVYQAYIEPHVATAWVDDGDTLVVQTATQGIFYTRDELAAIFGRRESSIRVEATPLGGSFGSKTLVVDPLAASAALVLRRPVRLVLDRRDDIASTNPAQGTRHLVRLGADAEGRFTGIDARLLFDGGAHTEWSSEEIGAILVAGPYRWPAFDIRSYGVRTNRVGTGSYRGPGGPQAAFALESLIDELAGRLDMDPLALRAANLVGAGDAMIDDDPWPPVGHREVLDAVAAHPIWRRRESLPPGEGVGVAIATWPGGKGSATALCRVDADGTLTVRTGVIDVSGTTGTFQAIAAEALGIAADDVRIDVLDSASAPPSPFSSGSVVTYSAGRAIREAAEDLRRRLLAFAAHELEIDPADLEIVDGFVRPLGSPDRGRSVAEFARLALARGGDDPTGESPLDGEASIQNTRLAPSTAAHLAHVRLDRETGAVSLLDYAIVQDVGRAINPALVEGQMRGGAVQGIGWALHEAMAHDEEGQLVTGSFLDYTVPRAIHVPDIDAVIVEVPSADGPFGAKGMAEAPVIPAGAAVASAIAAAGGPRLRDLPMTPPRIWAAMQDGGR